MKTNLMKISVFKSPRILISILLTLLLLFFVRRFSSSSFLFEQICLISMVVSAFVLKVRDHRQKKIVVSLISDTLILGLAIAFLLNSVLLNIDRSRSFYVLSWVQNKQIDINSTPIKIEIKSRESASFEAVLQRVEENQARGLISKDSDGLHLTRAGEFLLLTSNVLAHIFVLKNWEANKN